MAFSQASRWSQPQGAEPQAGQPVSNPDERPVGTGRTNYDLSFFDGDNEYETYGWEEMQRNEQLFQAYFSRYLGHLSSADAVSDADFDRDFTYERLLQLDEQLVRRGGLSREETHRICQPARNVAGETCPVCLEKTKVSERVCRLGCQHIFHCHCLQGWVAEHHTCPVCRSDLRGPRNEPEDDGAY